MIDKNFVESLPNDPIDALSLVVDTYKKEKRKLKIAFATEDMFKFLAIIKAISSKYDFAVPDAPELTNDSAKNRNIMNTYLADSVPKVLVKHRADKLLLSSVNEFSKYIGVEYLYEFSDDELTRINEIISDLRGIIGKSEMFDDDHQRRLLNKLEKLQSEVHKSVSDLDKFWGLIGDAGVVMGKFGKDAKPFVDRVKELSEITWKAQAKAEGLPEQDSMPLLTHDDSDV